MMEAIRSSETSVLTRAARHNITDDGVLQLNLGFQSALYLSDDVNTGIAAIRVN
jgi:hypothetical protein